MSAFRARRIELAPVFEISERIKICRRDTCFSCILNVTLKNVSAADLSASFFSGGIFGGDSFLLAALGMLKNALY